MVILVQEQKALLPLADICKKMLLFISYIHLNHGLRVWPFKSPKSQPSRWNL